MSRPKTIREAIHGDIKLEPQELAVINTRVFQRLHGIKQLGMAYLVYPTATHTRFEHALGCVHVAEQIIRQLRALADKGALTATVDGNIETPALVDLREKIRLAALLHDLPHIPYGHTLENELGVLQEHHDSTEKRVPRFFDRLKDEIRSDPTKAADELAPLIDYALSVMRTIKHIDREIRERRRLEPTEPLLPEREWFVADIIGNTICADLLDYARRDMRTTGLNQDYDDRLYSYFDLARDGNGRVRLAIRTAKEQGLRLDAVSEVLHVLRMRYTLSERVLFHHAKNVASAMLGEALSYIDFDAEALDQMRDDQLLPWISGQAKGQGLPPERLDAVERLVDALESRRLHKMVVRVGPDQQVPYEVEHARHLAQDFSNVTARQGLQDEMREYFPQLRPGDVIVYCPPRQMTMKEVWVNVLARKDDRVCRPLREEEEPYLPGVVLQEVEALERKYAALWAWTLLLSPEKLNYAFAMQGFVKEKLNVSNDPFLQGYLERQEPLKVGTQIMRRAPGENRLQARAIEIALEPTEIQKAAAGPPDEGGYWDDVVRRARDDLYPPPAEAP